MSQQTANCEKDAVRSARARAILLILTAVLIVAPFVAWMLVERGLRRP